MTRAYPIEVPPEPTPAERAPAALQLPLSPWWRLGAILVMIFGFSVLGVVIALTDKNAPPLPARVEDPSGKLRFSREDLERGQEISFRHGLMDHGTLWGHGAHLGADATGCSRLGSLASSRTGDWKSAGGPCCPV